MIKDAQGPLEEQHAEELAALEERVARYGERGAGRRDLVERHKRELRRHRADELRFGFATLAGRYRDELVHGNTRGAVAAIAAINKATEMLARNPNEPLLLQALFLQLPAEPHRA
jgi:DNA polymerase-3 subunit delta'